MASIAERGDKRWRIRVYAGLDPGTGKKRYITETFHGGYRDAQRRSKKLEIEVEDRGHTEMSKMTLRNYLPLWLESLPSRNVSPRTSKWYEEIVNNHLIPNLGTVQLKTLTPSTIESYRAKALKRGRVDGRGGLSVQTVQHHISVLSQALNHAVRMEELNRNVTQNVTSLRPNRKDVEPLTRDGVAKLLNAAYHTEYYYPLLVAVFTGVRRSELLGLTWKDINLEEKFLSVNRGLHTHSNLEERLQPPKSDKSKRRISLPNDLVLALRHFRENQEATWETLGIKLGLNDPIFARPDGSSMHPDSLSKAVVRMAKKPI